MSTQTIRGHLSEQEQNHEETHIMDLIDDAVALCGYKREDKPWHWGDPSFEATCAVCLALYESEVRAERGEL